MEKLKSFWRNHRENNWFIILLLLLFFPVGLYLMWRYSGWKKRPKLILTTIFGLLILFNMGGNDSSEKIIDEPDEVYAEAESETMETEKEEKSKSTEEAEKAAEEEAEKAAEEEAEKAAEEEAEKAAEEEAEKAAEEEAEKAAEEAEEEDLSPEEAIEAAVRKEPKAEISDVVITTDGTEALVSVTFEGRENFTLGLTKTGIHDSMTRILFSLKELDYDFLDITLMAELPLVDQYGNEELSVVMRGHFDSGVLEQINPDNKYIVQDNIQNIAIDWYEHPAMQD